MRSPIRSASKKRRSRRPSRITTRMRWTGLDPEFGRGSTIYQRHLGDASHSPNPCVAPIEQPPFYALRIYPADLGTAIGLQDGLPCTGSAQRRHRHRGPLCLRQRHGFDHERKLSGARHHARAGADIRLHRRPAPCADGRRRGDKHEKPSRRLRRQYLLLHFRRQRRRYRGAARGPGLWRGRTDVLSRPSLAGRA